MHTIKRNDESELKQKLLTPASRDNGIEKGVVVVVVFCSSCAWAFYLIVKEFFV